MSTPTGVAAVERALAILDAFRETNGILALAEIAKKTGLYKSTILRLLVSLELFGYVRRLDDGRYQIGPKVAELNLIFQESFRLREYVMPILERIVSAVNESASFFVRDKDSRLCLYRADTRQAIRDHIREGDMLELRRGASGKCLLKYDERSLADVTAKDFVFASFGERARDMAALAAPVFGVNGKFMGCISISGPRNRFEDAPVEKMKTALVEAAVELSIQIGAAPEPLEAIRAVLAPSSEHA